MRVKTKDALAFEAEFLAHLSQYNNLRQHIYDSYNPNKHGIEEEIFFYLNDKEYFTLPKKGLRTISKVSIDLDNMIKVANDQVFRWLGIDDSQVVKIHTEKIPTNAQATMVFRISLIPFPELFVVSPSEF
jgi:Holliday junction resolvase RusA-like endonuclease